MSWKIIRKYAKSWENVGKSEKLLPAAFKNKIRVAYVELLHIFHLLLLSHSLLSHAVLSRTELNHTVLYIDSIVEYRLSEC